MARGLPSCSGVCSSLAPLVPLRVLKMSIRKSVKAVFERARQKVPDQPSEILNRDELQKKLQSGTENNYQRRLELWQ